MKIDVNKNEQIWLASMHEIPTNDRVRSVGNGLCQDNDLNFTCQFTEIDTSTCIVNKLGKYYTNKGSI